MSDDDERRMRRERNNQSVRKCRENEKKKVENARNDLAKHKRDNRDLEEKYSSLRKELDVLKSLFQTSTTNTASSRSGTTSAAAAATSAAAATVSNENGVEIKPINEVNETAAEGTESSRSNATNNEAVALPEKLSEYFLRKKT
jgi:hypothetical protein